MMIFGHTPAEIIAVVSLIGTLVAAGRRYNITPQRVALWLASVKYSETANAAATYWEREYRKCEEARSQCQDARDSSSVSPGGSG